MLSYCFTLSKLIKVTVEVPNYISLGICIKIIYITLSKIQGLFPPYCLTYLCIREHEMY